MKHKIKKVVVFGLNNVGEKILKYIKKDKSLKVYLFKKKNLPYGKIRNISPDILLSLGYRFKVDKKILILSKIGAFNIHKSLLPMNKGANPVFWTILLNKKAGISIHRMNSKIDSGDIVMQKKINYIISDTAKSLYEKLEIHQFLLFKNFWNKIKKGEIRKIKTFFKPSFHKKKEFRELISLKKINKKKFFNFINFLRASTFPPFQNIVLRENNQNYRVEINIKKIKKNKKIRYKNLLSYK